MRLGDTRRLDSSTQDILVRRHIVGRRNPVDGVKVANGQLVSRSRVANVLGGRVVQLKLIPPVECFPDALILPQPRYSIHEHRWHLPALDLYWRLHDRLEARVVGRVDGDAHEGDTVQKDPHGLDRVGVDDLSEGVAFFGVVGSVRQPYVS